MNEKPNDRMTKVTLNLPTEQVTKIQNCIHNSSFESITSFIKNAIDVNLLLQEEKTKGGKIIVENKFTREKKELIFFPTI